MRSKKEIINSVFYVINTKSIDSLDGVDIFIQRAFENLYAKKSTLVDKHIAFNQLVTKFEAYLKSFTTLSMVKNFLLVMKVTLLHGRMRSMLTSACGTCAGAQTKPSNSSISGCYW